MEQNFQPENQRQMLERHPDYDRGGNLHRGGFDARRQVADDRFCPPRGHHPGGFSGEQVWTLLR